MTDAVPPEEIRPSRREPDVLDGERLPDFAADSAPKSSFAGMMYDLVRQPVPGFALAVVFCVVMLVLTQVLLAVGALAVMWVVKAVAAGADAAMKWLQTLATDPSEMGVLVVISHTGIILLSLLALRLVAGRDWRREVAVRLPHPGHVLLAIIALPAFWVTAMGSYLVATKILPTLAEVVNISIAIIILLLIVGVVWVVMRLADFDWIKATARAPLGVQFAVGPFVAALVIGQGVLLYNLLYVPALRVGAFDEQQFMEQFVESVRQWHPIVAVLIIGGMPGLSEELWCRAFLGRGLVGRHGLVLGVLWTSVFFGAIHVHPQQGAMAVLAGIGLHYMYLTSRSLLIPMFVHFLNNSLAVVADKIPGPIGEKLGLVDTDPDKIPWYLFASAAALMAAVVWAFYVTRGRLVREDGSEEGAWQPPYPGVVLPPPDSGTVVVHDGPGLLPVVAVFLSAAALAGSFAVM